MAPGRRHSRGSPQRAGTVWSTPPRRTRSRHGTRSRSLTPPSEMETRPSSRRAMRPGTPPSTQPSLEASPSPTEDLRETVNKLKRKLTTEDLRQVLVRMMLTSPAAGTEEPSEPQPGPSKRPRTDQDPGQFVAARPMARFAFEPIPFGLTESPANWMARQERKKKVPVRKAAQPWTEEEWQQEATRQGQQLDRIEAVQTRLDGEFSFLSLQMRILVTSLQGFQPPKATDTNQ